MNNNYESMRRFLVTSLLVCSCAVTHAQPPTDAANQRIPSEQHPSIGQPRVDADNRAQVDAASVAQYAYLVEKLESDFGPFNARLGEPLIAACDMLAELGDYHEAVRVAERALHIMRINQGLYSEAQIAIVERLIEFNVAMQDWAAVNDNFRYLEFLYTRLFDVGSLKWDYGISQVADWHVIAINNNLGEDREEHLREANKLFKLRLVYAEQDERVNQQVIDVLRHNVKYTAYHLQRRSGEIKTERIYSRFESRYRDEDREGSLASID